MYLRFNFDACPMHSPFGFVHLTHQNLSARALFCHNSLAKVNTQLLIYKYLPTACEKPFFYKRLLRIMIISAIARHALHKLVYLFLPSQ